MLDYGPGIREGAAGALHSTALSSAPAGLVTGEASTDSRDIHDKGPASLNGGLHLFSSFPDVPGIMMPQTSTRAMRKLFRSSGRQCPRYGSVSRRYGLRPLHTSDTTVSRRVTATSSPPRAPGTNTPSQTRAARITVSLSLLSLLAGGSLFASMFGLSQLAVQENKLVGETCAAVPSSADSRDPTLPRFRLSDVRVHNASSERPWVTYEDKVYDITDWVAAHPGGDVILRAAGGSVDAYWAIFSIHKQPHVREILDQYLLGYIDSADLVDGRPVPQDVEDPFVDDPARDLRLRMHTVKPCNAEPPNSEVDAAFRTPNELFYVRNHMWVPVVADNEGDEHALTVELPDGETRRYTVAELKTRFRRHRVTAALQCSGNRRSDMTRHAAKTNGLQWGVGAISNAEWEGVRLSDVLADAGLKVADAQGLTSVGGAPDEAQGEAANPNTHHVQFSGLEAYGASIPLAKALDPRGDVLLAFGMNGSTLPRDHGFPLRALVPGHVAARSVKWLNRIVVSDEESTTQWQRRDYKAFGPNEGANPDWDRAPAIQEMPVTSAITGVWVGECVRSGKVPWMGKVPGRADKNTTIVSVLQKDSAGNGKQAGGTPPSGVVVPEPIVMQGYAYSGGGREIRRVDVSVDDGKTWDQAELLDDCAAEDGRSACKGNQHWAWRRWRYQGQLLVPAQPQPADGSDSRQGNEHCTTLIVKATDEAYNGQPETHAGIYNVRGNLATAWHRLRICPTCTGAAAEKASVTWSTGRAYGCGFETERTATGTK